MHRFTRQLVLGLATAICTLALTAQDLDTSRSEMRATIERYSVDRAIQNRSAPIDYSAANSARMKQFYTGWLGSLDRLDFDSLSQDGRIDYLLFRNQLNYESRQVDTRAANFVETAAFLPFAQTIIDFEESRRRMESMDSDGTRARRHLGPTVRGMASAGELDTNVDPASTLQVANALIKANKKFDLLAVPGGGHGAGGAYYQRLLQDFFVHHLLGAEPPDWNRR